MDEQEYDCGRFKGKIKTTEQWDSEHSPHGEPRLVDHFGRFQWRICPCGAKQLEIKNG